MKNRTIFATTLLLLVFVSLSCLVSELSWSAKISSPDPLRQLIGLPSLAVGNLNPSARDPGLEFLCVSLYDVPGGYCYYFTSGVPATNFTVTSTITQNVTGRSR